MRTPVPGGFGFPLGAALAVAATFLVVAVGATSQPVLSVVALVAVVDTMAFVTTGVATLAIAVVCWFLHAGFVLGRFGEVAYTGQSGHDALVLGLNALGAVFIASMIRAAVAPLHEREYDRNVPVIPEQQQRVPILTGSERNPSGS